MTPAELVILFTDIHEFSSVVKELGKSGRCGSQFIQEVYQDTGEAAIERGGEILQYHGDGILAVFPAGSESDVVQCAIDMREAYARVVDRWQLAHDTELEVGISAGTAERQRISIRRVSYDVDRILRLVDDACDYPGFESAEKRQVYRMRLATGCYGIRV